MAAGDGKKEKVRRRHTSSVGRRKGKVRPAQTRSQCRPAIRRTIPHSSLGHLAASPLSGGQGFFLGRWAALPPLSEAAAGGESAGVAAEKPAGRSRRRSSAEKSALGRGRPEFRRKIGRGGWGKRQILGGKLKPLPIGTDPDIENPKRHHLRPWTEPFRPHTHWRGPPNVRLGLDVQLEDLNRFDNTWEKEPVNFPMIGFGSGPIMRTGEKWGVDAPQVQYPESMQWDSDTRPPKPIDSPKTYSIGNKPRGPKDVPSLAIMNRLFPKKPPLEIEEMWNFCNLITPRKHVPLVHRPGTVEEPPEPFMGKPWDRSFLVPPKDDDLRKSRPYDFYYKKDDPRYGKKKKTSPKNIDPDSDYKKICFYLLKDLNNVEKLNDKIKI